MSDTPTESMLDDRIAELEDENAALLRENAALRALLSEVHLVLFDNHHERDAIIKKLNSQIPKQFICDGIATDVYAARLEDIVVVREEEKP